MAVPHFLRTGARVVSRVCMYARMEHMRGVWRWGYLGKQGIATPCQCQCYSDM